MSSCIHHLESRVQYKEFGWDKLLFRLLIKSSVCNHFPVPKFKLIKYCKYILGRLNLSPYEHRNIIKLSRVFICKVAGTEHSSHEAWFALDNSFFQFFRQFIVTTKHFKTFHLYDMKLFPEMLIKVWEGILMTHVIIKDFVLLISSWIFQK